MADYLFSFEDYPFPAECSKSVGVVSAPGTFPISKASMRYGARLISGPSKFSFHKKFFQNENPI